ncbi:unnamed protein product [Paramecium sonneborni]|uniref:Protein translocase subunit SecA n=1 Tax=Paramecium sonneborni TaxID=65129 RepID=A0A8S1NJU5_9CILI|nr:unnamed protein product [Paramecium sonneborni]
MQGLQGNKNWSAEEQESFQLIINSFDLNQDQTQILQQQIQNFKNAEKIIDYLLDCDSNWNKFQEKIQKEIQNQIRSQQIEPQWNEEQLGQLENKLLKQIKSKKEIKQLVQYIQSANLDKEVINEVLDCEFESSDDFLQLITIFEQSNTMTKIHTQKRQQEFVQDRNERDIWQNEQNILNQVNKGNNNEKELENQQMQDLFTEFYSLNRRSNQQIQILLQNLYNSLKNQQQNNINVTDFKVSAQLEYEDLLHLCVKVKQQFKYYPRPVQLLSVIELYNHNTNKGRLAQIYTGEGKTLIVAMLAILICKKKRVNVDIVTSSPVLAIRDAQELAQFYQLFQVSVSHNINGQLNQKQKMYPCYNNQVIYGDPHSFQADILRHEYSELGTMGNRQQGYVIIDEVDSMLIDGNSNKTLLSSPIPGMLDLTKVLRLIWDEICKVEPNLLTNKKVWIRDKDNNLTVDLEEYILSTLDIQLKETLLNYIPKFRLNYINFIKKKWIQNAINAKFHLHENKHYKVDNNNIRIIDYQNTGVVHKDNMQWEKGLHQFIQLKHNLPITPLRISTNYISNVSFFKRYNTNLLGLTGTLGSQVTQKLLSKQYNVDFIFMPPYKKRLLKEETGIATLSEQEWLDEILKAVQQQMNKRRAVLIINQTINDVNRIQSHLMRYNLNSIKYVDDSQNISKEIGPRTIIIATNLAGRGTDLSINQELERNGGLHVIMSFLPRNIRIQLQGFGRSGRQGKQGTAQLIVNFQQSLYIGTINDIKTIQDAINYYKILTNKQNYQLLDVLIYFRDLNEEDYSNEIEQEMAKLLNEDKCFQRFCQIAKSKVKIQENRAGFQALEEKWGLYLEEFQDVGLNVNHIEQQLDSDEGQNPRYLILQGLEQDDIKPIKKAAELQINDPQAQYYKGLYEIKQKDFQSGIKSLRQARSMILSKMDDEKGFATASKLNRVQVDQFQNNNRSMPNMQMQEIQVDVQSQILPQLDFTASTELENISVIQFGDSRVVQQDHFDLEIDHQFKGKDQKLVTKFDNFDLKVDNQLKVYAKVISNIDDIINTLQNFNQNDEELELTWQSVLEKDENGNVESEQTVKDQEEVMQDGPLPKLGKITKVKKERKWWEYGAMFIIGLGQFIVGCAICASTCGLALPIGRTLIQEGFSDMIYSVTAAWKGIDINWGEWGKNKVINVATSLALAGPAGIEEALKLGGSAWKSLEKIGIKQFLKQIPAVTAEGLKKAGFWLTDIEKIYIQGQYDTMQQVSQATQSATNNNQILNIAQQIMQQQVDKGVITSETATDLFGIVDQSLQDSVGNPNTFKNMFCQMAQNFIRLQMAKSKSEQDPSQFKDDLISICSREGNKKYNNVQKDIEQYNQYKKALNNELDFFTKNILNCYQTDQELQKILFILDLYYEKLCDPLKVSNAIQNYKVQEIITQNFNPQSKFVQQKCQSLQLTNPQSVNLFYQTVIRPPIYKFCIGLKDNNQYTEPLEIQFYLEYQNQYEAQFQLIKQNKQDLDQKQAQLKQQQEYIQSLGNNQTQNQVNQYNQLVDDFNNECKLYEQKTKQFKQIQEINNQQLIKEIVAYMKNKKMINNNGITFSQSFLQEFNKYLNNQNYNPIIKQILLQAMQNSINQISNLKTQSKQILTSKLQLALEVEMIEGIKKQIFESRMLAADKNIINKID